MACDFDEPGWSGWPVCSQCGQRRSARCPVCGATRTDFSLADMQELAGGQSVLLHCDDCDDVILPEWYRLCAACGHDFGGGIEVVRPNDDNSRVDNLHVTWLIFAGLAGAAILLVTYFAWLLGRV